MDHRQVAVGFHVLRLEAHGLLEVLHGLIELALLQQGLRKPLLTLRSPLGLQRVTGLAQRLLSLRVVTTLVPHFAEQKTCAVAYGRRDARPVQHFGEQTARFKVLALRKIQTTQQQLGVVRMVPQQPLRLVHTQLQ